MKSKGDTLLKLAQSRLPHARVFWDPPPDNFFEKQSCKLVAVNLKDPSKRGSVDYRDGIAKHTAETFADDFVAHIGPEVTD